MSYLDNALHHQPVKLFDSKHANRAVDFFVSRAKFLVGIVEKVVDLARTFFKLIVLDTIPAIINLAPGRANTREDVKQILDDIKDLPVGVTGLIFGCTLANKLNDKINAPVVVVPPAAVGGN
jgi:hypothetical protein